MSDCTPTYRSLIPKLLRSVAGLAVACTMVSCINEDLSDCGSYCDFNFRFTTELEMEWIINSHLSAGAAEQEMSRLLIEKLNPVFSGKIYHLEVPFFESGSRGNRPLRDRRGRRRQRGELLALPAARHLSPPPGGQCRNRARLRYDDLRLPR